MSDTARVQTIMLPRSAQPGGPPTLGGALLTFPLAVNGAGTFTLIPTDGGRMSLVAAYFSLSGSGATMRFTDPAGDTLMGAVTVGIHRLRGKRQNPVVVVPAGQDLQVRTSGTNPSLNGFLVYEQGV
jgi:hypothetical protein